MAGYDDRDGKIWMDGTLVDWREANVHILTHALHYASSVFEGERCYDGKIFLSREHSERLLKSGELMDMQIPYSVDQIEAAKRAVLDANGLDNAYVRVVAFRGAGEDMGVASARNPVRMAVAAWEWGNYYGDAKMKGAKLDIAKWKRPSPETIPTAAKAAGLYMICTMSRREADGRGFDDALMLDYRGYVAEATGANIFFGRGKELHTPTPDCFLDGITRRTVMGLAREAGYTIVERHIRPEEMAEFDECFLTGSAAEVTPVRQIGDYSFKPAEACSTLLHAYSDLVRVEGRAARAAAAAE